MKLIISFLMYSALCLLTHGKTRKAHRSDGRIAGGTNASIFDHPYQLALYKSDSFIGGASIISTTWALTAAQNVYYFDPNEATLRAGSTNNEEGGSIHQVDKKVNHIRYDFHTKDYDIALLRVVDPFVFGPGVAAIKLPPSGQEPAVGTIVTVTGWGRLSYVGHRPNYLQVVTLPIISRPDCSDAYGRAITDRMICAGYLEGGKDACKGDSGGPAVANGQLIGIISWGKGCAWVLHPGVYTKVSYFTDWIAQNSGVKNN